MVGQEPYWLTTTFFKKDYMQRQLNRGCKSFKRSQKCQIAANITIII